VLPRLGVSVCPKEWRALLAAEESSGKLPKEVTTEFVTSKTPELLEETGYESIGN
jgi:hypothetical protein